MPTSIGVVGGGMLGMTLARRLRSSGSTVTIVEGDSRSGGLTAPAAVGGFTWDRFYHVILQSDAHVLDLLDDLGLSKQLHWGPARTGFYIDGRLHPFSSTLDYARFPALSLSDKLRLVAMVIHASRVRDWKSLESIRATEWLRHWCGPRTVDRVWLPLLRAKLGANAELASAAFIWAIIARLYGADHTPMRRARFGYVDGGYDTILSRLEAALEAEGISRRYAAPVVHVEGDPDGATVSLRGGESLRFDAVILTLPCGQVSGLCPQLRAAERTRLEGVTYQGIVCATLLLRRPLADYYVTNITDPGVPFTAVIEMTALVDRSAFDGHSLVYLPRYAAQDDPVWQCDDSTIERTSIAALQRMYPHFHPRDVGACQVSRAREILAVSTVGYSEHLAPPVRTSIPNVFVVNSAQIVNGTLNVNETIGLAEEKALELRHHFAAGSRAHQLPLGAL